MRDRRQPFAVLARSWSSRMIPRCANFSNCSSKDEGYRAATAPDGLAALELVTQGAVRPDLILADYNLPNGMDGLQVAAKLREKLHRQIPVIILTGDISTGTLRHIALQNCVQLNKPVKLKELTQAIQRLLPASPPATDPRAAASARSGRQAVGRPSSSSSMTIARCAMRFAACWKTMAGSSRILRLARHSSRPVARAVKRCLVIDAYLPGMSGLELLQRLNDAGHHLPAIMITGNSDVAMAVEAMKAGASDFIEKPISREELLACVERALEQSRDSSKLSVWREEAAAPPGGSHAAAARDHGYGACGPSQQEYRRGSRYQPAHGGESPCLDHEEDRLQIAAGVGPAGAGRGRE